MAAPAFNPNQAYETPAFDPTASYEAAAGSAAQATRQPSLSEVLLQPTDKTDDEYLGYTGAAGVAGAAMHGLNNVARGATDAVKGAIASFDPRAKDDEEKQAVKVFGSPTVLPVYRLLRSLGHTASDAMQLAGAVHDINQSADPLGTYLHVADQTAGQAAGQALTAIAGEGVRQAPGAIKAGLETPAGEAAIAGTKQLAKSAIKKVPYVGPVAEDVYNAGRTAYDRARAGREPAPTYPGAPEPAKPPAEVLQARGLERGGQPYVDPAAGLSRIPVKPEAAPLTAADELEGVTSAQTEGAGQGAEVEEPTPGPPAAPKADTTPRAVEQQLSEALGGRPLAPGVPLKQQPMTRTVVTDPATGRPEFSDVLQKKNAAAKPAPMPKPAPAPAKLPEGFTPTQSSVLRGYKYNPEAQEFEAVTNTGAHYIHGEVTADDYAKFLDDSDKLKSAGKAWNVLKDNHVYVAKVLNGQRKAVTGFSAIDADQGNPSAGQIPKKQAGNRTVQIDENGRPEFSDVLEARRQAATPPAKRTVVKDANGRPEFSDVAAKKNAGDDLTAQLQQSLDPKGGIRTTADPADLAKRWGVDKTSIAATDEKLRGMDPKQSADYIAKLADSYRKGQPVEPVIETRDASNNIVEVDGRHRALAAQQAGVDRIPIVVRRQGAAAAEAPTIPQRIRKPLTREAPNAAATESQQGSEATSRPISPAPGASAATPSGTETSVRVPGEDRAYKATYQVRELGDVHPSHSGITFNPSEKYALVNDRDYSNPLNQGKVVTNSAPGKFDPSYHITDNPDATNGPVVIDSDGHALGGNGRAMILQRVYKYNPEGAAAYRDLLAKKAAQFGIDAKQLEGMKEPVLVRQLHDAELEGAGKQNAITDFNKSGTAAMTPAERAIADSRRVSQGTLDDIAVRLEHEGNESTLADLLRGKSGTQVLDKLIGDGVLTAQERAGLATGEQLTEAGAERIRKLLVARFFKDPAQIDTTPAAVRSKLESMTAPLARVDGVPEWDLTEHVQEAMSLLEEARAHGTKNLDDLLGQRGFWGDSKYKAEAITMAKAIQGSSARTLQQAVKRYAADMADAHRPLLQGTDTITPAQAFRDAFEDPKPAPKNAAAERATKSEGSLF